MSERLPENTRRPGAKNKAKPAGSRMHKLTGAEIRGRRRSKKSTSALGKLNQNGRAVPGGPRVVAPAFTAAAGRAPAPAKPSRLSAADRRAVAQAAKAKRPTSAQRDLLAAAATRKAAANARRSASMAKFQARRQKLATLGKAGKVSTGKYTPRGPMG